MVIGVRMEPELERQLNLLARQQDKIRRDCIRKVIHQDLLRRHGHSQADRRGSEHLAQLERPNWSEQRPDGSDWKA
ncbi:MAG: hypothetical protein ACK6AD_14285 [Cyanobacteriota bacterium]|jgi:hypothetical protein